MKRSRTAESLGFQPIRSALGKLRAGATASGAKPTDVS